MAVAAHLLELRCAQLSQGAVKVFPGFCSRDTALLTVAVVTPLLEPGTVDWWENFTVCLAASDLMTFEDACLQSNSLVVLLFSLPLIF